jgi:YHS domain-containing protein
MAIDPICGMTVEEKTAQLTSEYDGQTYYFCSPGCKRTFDKEPQKYSTKPAMGHGGTGHHA